MSGFDDEVAEMTEAVMDDLGTPATLRLPSGRQYAVNAVIDRAPDFVGEFNQAQQWRTIASLQRIDGITIATGAELHVPDGTYQGRYTLAALDEGDGYVDRFALRALKS